MSPKKISHRDITGDRGIALIHTIVGEMGFVWNATGLEAGIDGYIEIRDVTTGDVTNLIVQVQSKATGGTFSAETLEGFDYYCDPRDIEYWLGGNAPVILVCSRPSTNEAYWVSIKDYFKDLPTRGTRKIHFNKFTDKFDRTCNEKLVSLAKPKDSGIYLASLPKEEKVISNLLEVGNFAQKIYIAETDVRNHREMWHLLRHRVSDVGCEWMLKNKKIISFHKLDEHPWSEVCDQRTVEVMDSKEWAYSDDTESKNDFSRLLNLGLRQKVWPEVKFDTELEYYFFAPTDDLAPRELPYKSLVHNTARTVFQAYFKKRDPSQISYYRHSAFSGKFLRFERNWYLEITPDYHFTYNGFKPSKYREDLLKGIKQLERNPAVLGQVTMWADYLGEKEDMFAKRYPFLSFGSLVPFDIECGLDDDSWLHREERDKVESASLPINELPELPLFSSLK